MAMYNDSMKLQYFYLGAIFCLSTTKSSINATRIVDLPHPIEGYLLILTWQYGFPEIGAVVVEEEHSSDLM